MEFSTNLKSGIELTFDDLMVISNSLINAMENCKSCLSDESLSQSIKTEISDNLVLFSEMREKIIDYMSHYGFSVIPYKLVE